MKADFKADVSVLQNSEAFQSRAELIKFMMLQQIKTRPDGLGAWELPVMLSKEGLDVRQRSAGISRIWIMRILRGRSVIVVVF